MIEPSANPTIDEIEQAAIKLCNDVVDVLRFHNASAGEAMLVAITLLTHSYVGSDMKRRVTPEQFASDVKESIIKGLERHYGQDNPN